MFRKNEEKEGERPIGKQSKNVRKRASLRKAFPDGSGCLETIENTSFSETGKSDPEPISRHLRGAIGKVLKTGPKM